MIKRENDDSKRENDDKRDNDDKRERLRDRVPFPAVARCPSRVSVCECMSDLHLLQRRNDGGMLISC